MKWKLIGTLLWFGYQLLTLWIAAQQSAGAAELFVGAPPEALEPVSASPSIVAPAADAPVAWRWSAAAPHHGSMGIVESGAGAVKSRGSGTLIEIAGRPCVITAAHVVRDGPPFTIRWRAGGVSHSQTYLHSRDGADVAVVILEQAPMGITPIRLARRSVRHGEWVEVCGFGGPGAPGLDTLRHFWARAAILDSRLDGELSLNAGAMHGDSGGAVLLHDGRGGVELATILTTGEGAPSSRILPGGTADWYERAECPNPPRVLAFCARVAQHELLGCGPNGCPPSGGADLYPPLPPELEPFPPQPIEPTPYAEPPREDREASLLGPILCFLIVAAAFAAAIAKRV